MAELGDERIVGRRGVARATDADREQTIDALKAAFAQGALDKDELDGRIEQALTARTRAEVSALTAERGGDRRLPIWIGPAEATALALTLESVEMPRPFPYKLAAGLVQAAGSQITEVRITRLLESVFYACVMVQGPGGRQEVDARPSDAVNLALACGAPIRLNGGLFSATAADVDGEEASSFAVATADIAAEAQ
jgi:bifunctional DNase/RNase